MSHTTLRSHDRQSVHSVARDEETRRRTNQRINIIVILMALRDDFERH